MGSVNTNLRCPVFSEVRCPLFLGLRSHLFRSQVVISSLDFGVDRALALPSRPALRFILEPVALTLDVDRGRVMEQSVEDGGGQGVV